MRRSRRLRLAAAVAAFPLVLLTPSTALGWGGDDGWAPRPPDGDSAQGSAQGPELAAEVSRSRIVVTQPGAGTAKPSAGRLAPVDPNWRPPACWYEPLASPQQLKEATEPYPRTE
ncbi:hypothetical protein ACWEJ7_26725 [Streptomyces albidoflavus]